jgi:hypothetical protein
VVSTAIFQSAKVDCVEMSLQIEYRRLAAACLDLAKRAAAQTDKTRLLLIAEAWLDLADRVTRNNGQITDTPSAETTDRPITL